MAGQLEFLGALDLQREQCLRDTAACVLCWCFAALMMAVELLCQQCFGTLLPAYCDALQLEAATNVGFWGIAAYELVGAKSKAREKAREGKQ